jgi:hypothetical protein
MNGEMRLEIFTDNYLECVAWVDCNDDQDEAFADSLGFSDEMLLEAKNDSKRFLEIVGDKLPDELLSQAGHDLWLTRNGHGTGFWDRPEIYGQENSDYFTSLCHWHDGEFREKYVYVGDDNLIYFG